MQIKNIMFQKWLISLTLILLSHLLLTGSAYSSCVPGDDCTVKSLTVTGDTGDPYSRNVILRSIPSYSYYNISLGPATNLQYNATGWDDNINYPYGFGNIAIGEALWSNTTGGRNIAIGMYTLDGNTTGNNNIAIGHEALRQNIDGRGNVGIGTDSLMFNTYGMKNSAYGAKSLRNNTYGEENVAIGLEALDLNTTGNYNVAIGAKTATTAYANTTGSYNVFIGYGSGPDTDGSIQFDNATAIGKNARVGASNTMILGGTGVDSVNVGIGTTAPEQKLHVIGNIKANGIVVATQRIVAEDRVDTLNDFFTVSAGGGIIVKSPNGQLCKRIGIDNNGSIIGTTVQCPF